MTTRRPRSAAALVGLVLALSSVCQMATAASARPAGDRLPTARHRVLGRHLTNHHTHVSTSIIGFYRYPRLVRIHHRWRRQDFYGLRVSAQRCDRHHCWGRALEGRLTSPRQPGRPVRRGGAASTSAAQSDLCLNGTTACAAPWNWLTRYIDRRQRALVNLYVDPCAKGSLAGGGVVLAKDLSARILFEGGVLTAARAGSVFEGPPGMALGALAGCMTGVGAGGIRTVRALVAALNPFDRAGLAHD
jgi:hypothetical protein